MSHPTHRWPSATLTSVSIPDSAHILCLGFPLSPVGFRMVLTSRTIPLSPALILLGTHGILNSLITPGPVPPQGFALAVPSARYTLPPQASMWVIASTVTFPNF